MTYKAGVVGAAGFAGAELVRYLISHPSFDLEFITSDANAGMRISEMYPAFEGESDLVFRKNDFLNECNVDVVFLAVPHTAALSIAPDLLKRDINVVDLSADFRIKDADIYEKWYGADHSARVLLEKAAFGLPEITGQELAEAAARCAEGESVLVACAGCYPTATSLAAAPALAAGVVPEDAIVIADAISGVTGAGKKATERTHFCFANDNLEAYGLVGHRHTPEIEQILGIEGRLVFTPHLAPLNRGLLSTVNIPIDRDTVPENCTSQYFIDVYKRYYDGCGFVEVLPAGTQPKTSSVVGSNKAQIGLAYNDRVSVLIAVTAIDNLGKGAAGQAVQCANIVFGLDPECGLRGIPLPI